MRALHAVHGLDFPHGCIFPSYSERMYRVSPTLAGKEVTGRGNGLLLDPGLLSDTAGAATSTAAAAVICDVLM